MNFIPAKSLVAVEAHADACPAAHFARLIEAELQLHDIAEAHGDREAMYAASDARENAEALIADAEACSPLGALMQIAVAAGEANLMTSCEMDADEILERAERIKAALARSMTYLESAFYIRRADTRHGFYI